MEKSIGGLIIILLLIIGATVVYKGSSYDATLYTGDPEALESTRVAVEGKAATVRGAGDLRAYEMAGAPATAQATQSTGEIPAMVAGLSPMGPTESYTPETLYEKITGRAPAYLQFNFQKLTSRSFIIDGTSGDFIDAYLFRMDSPINAYGIFSIERSEVGGVLDFIADGYRNRRVIVFDGATGEYLRHWGAYGETAIDDYDYDFGGEGHAASPPEQFSTVHGLTGSNDGLIYVADRRGNRIQVFQHDGTFVTEKIIQPRTLASGSSFVIELSPDEGQEWLYLADGTNHKVWILRRSDLEVVGEFGRGGRQVGQFLRPHGMGVDSQGNIYIGEASTGRRIQKFSVN